MIHATLGTVVRAWVAGCSSRAVPDPRSAADEYAEAAAKGDSARALRSTIAGLSPVEFEQRHSPRLVGV